MKKIVLAATTVIFAAAGAAAADDRPVVVKEVFEGSTTNSGQPLVLPQANPKVIFSTYDIAPGAVLPLHKHPFARYGYVMAGTLEVTNTDAGISRIYKPGDVIIEAIGQWHKGATIGDEPVKLLVIDQVEGERSNVVLKPAP